MDTQTVERDLDDPASLTALELVRQRAPETKFGPLVARPVEGHGNFRQVNRVDKHGQYLRGGWTFLVNLKTNVVIRTTGDPETVNFQSALQTGTQCRP